MKKSVIALMSVVLLSTGVVQAATTDRPVSKWLSDTAAKVEQREDAAYKKIEADKKASEARKKERQNAIEQQKKELQQRQKAREDAIKKQQEEIKAKREAREKRIETKKKQWNDLINN